MIVFDICVRHKHTSPIHILYVHTYIIRLLVCDMYDTSPIHTLFFCWCLICIHHLKDMLEFYRIQTFQIRMVMSYWLASGDEMGEMAAPMAILLFVCTKPAQRRL